MDMKTIGIPPCTGTPGQPRAFRPALHIRDIFFCAYESVGVCLPFTP